MDGLCSPDGRLRIDLALRAGSREVEAGTPCLRVLLDRRVLLAWSPLAFAGSDGTAAWRRDRGCSVRDVNQLPDGAETEEAVCAFVPLRKTGTAFAVTLRCAGLGVACRTAPAMETRFRFPLETQGIMADAAAPGGFSRRPVARALADSPLPVTLLYPHGKCAVMRREVDGWLLIAGDRPADLPANRVRGWLAGGASESGAVDGPASVVPSDAAAFNCHLPFVVTPSMSAPQPMLWAAPRLENVTPAHAAALQRLRALEWRDADVRWIRGEIGEYVQAACRRGASWQVSALTAKARAWTLRLPFLEPGRRYRAAWRHDPPPERPCFQPLPGEMDADCRPLIWLADAGGFTLDLEPLDTGGQEV